MGLKEPFTGSVPLQTGEIGDDFSYYFAVSEQTPSVVSVGVLVNDTNEILASGGFIIQLLPEATEEDITYIENAVKNCPPVSQLINDGKTTDNLHFPAIFLPEIDVSYRVSYIPKYVGKPNKRKASPAFLLF